MAAAALALSGAGLMITGVANAVTAPTLAPGKIVDGPLDLPGAYADVPTGTPASDPVTDPASDPAVPTTDPADPGSSAPVDPTTDPADPTSAPDPTTTSAADPSTTPGGGSSSSAAAAAGGGSGGSGGGTLVQAAPRQSLAETGTDSSVPFLLAGGFTLLAGGAVFRFGPRTAAPRHGA